MKRIINWWLVFYIFFFFIAIVLLLAHLWDVHISPLWAISESKESTLNIITKTLFTSFYMVLIPVEMFKNKLVKLSVTANNHWFFSKKFQRDYCNWSHKMKWNGWKIIGLFLLLMILIIAFTVLAIMLKIRSFPLFFMWSLYSYIIYLFLKSKSFCFYNRDNLNQF